MLLPTHHNVLFTNHSIIRRYAYNLSKWQRQMAECNKQDIIKNKHDISIASMEMDAERLWTPKNPVLSISSFLTSAVDGGEWSASRPGRDLAPGKGPAVPIG
jgi:hypothetical protein